MDLKHPRSPTVDGGDHGAKRARVVLADVPPWPCRHCGAAWHAWTSCTCICRSCGRRHGGRRCPQLPLSHYTPDGFNVPLVIAAPRASAGPPPYRQFAPNPTAPGVIHPRPEVYGASIPGCSRESHPPHQAQAQHAERAPASLTDWLAERRQLLYPRPDSKGQDDALGPISSAHNRCTAPQTLIQPAVHNAAPPGPPTTTVPPSAPKTKKKKTKPPTAPETNKTLTRSQEWKGLYAHITGVVRTAVRGRAASDLEVERRVNMAMSQLQPLFLGPANGGDMALPHKK